MRRSTSNHLTMEAHSISIVSITMNICTMHGNNSNMSQIDFESSESEKSSIRAVYVAALDCQFAER